MRRGEGEPDQRQTASYAPGKRKRSEACVTKMLLSRMTRSQRFFSSFPRRTYKPLTCTRYGTCNDDNDYDNNNNVCIYMAHINSHRLR